MMDPLIIEGKTIETGCKDGNHPMPLHKVTIEANPMVPANLIVVQTFTDLGLLVGHQIKTDSDAIIAKNLDTSSETVSRKLKMKLELETATICIFWLKLIPPKSHTMMNLNYLKRVRTLIS